MFFEAVTQSQTKYSAKAFPLLCKTEELIYLSFEIYACGTLAGYEASSGWSLTCPHN